MNRLAAEIVFALVVYTFGFHVGHYCGFVQRDRHLNEKTPALLQQPEARSTLLEKGSTMVRVKQSSHGVESGKTYGSRTVLGMPFSVGKKRWLAVVQCECGKIETAWCVNLATGKSDRCKSCQVAERNTTHGEAPRGTKARLYTIWCNMMSRCNRRSSPAYRWYGAKGVRVCAEWSTYQGFRSWAVSNGYKENLTIDRIDSNGNYEPMNCEWVTGLENTRRRNSSVKVGV